MHSFTFRITALVLAVATMALTRSSPPLHAADEPATSATDVSASVAEWLQYTRASFEKNHLIARMKFESVAGRGAPTEFRYDRYPELERIQTAADGASFVRKTGRSWMKSDDWGETGRPVKPAQAQQLDGWRSLVHAPLNNVSKSRDPSQGGIVMRLVEQVPDGDNERLIVQVGRERQTGLGYPTFTFYRYKDAKPTEARLQEFTGTMYLGPDKLMTHIRYDYLFRVRVTSESPAPSSSPEPAASPAATRRREPTAP